MATTGMLCWYFNLLVGDLVLGSVTGTYFSLFQKLIRRMPTVTPSLLNQNIESLDTILRSVTRLSDAIIFQFRAH